MAQTVEPVTAYHAFAITASNTTVLSPTPSAIYIGTPGDLNVVMESGETVLFLNLSAGALMPIRVKQVLATSTSVTGLIGLTY